MSLLSTNVDKSKNKKVLFTVDRRIISCVFSCQAVYRIRSLSEMDVGLALHDLRDGVGDTEIGRKVGECLVQVVS